MSLKGYSQVKEEHSPPSSRAFHKAGDAFGVPEIGQLVTIRDRQWVVSDVSGSSLARDVVTSENRQAHHLVSLVSIEDDALGDELQVIWELELGRKVVDHATLPTPDPKGFDDPERLEAFLDAIRWGAIASADPRHLQAPFRSGITIEDYQLDPVVRALRMPRVNLLIADDVGLGKTIEAGLVVQELILRHRARTVLVVCPSSLCLKWKAEMQEKFGLEFRIVNSDLLRHLRRTRGLYANPFTHFPRLIVSIDWLKRDRPMRLLKDVLPSTPAYPRKLDLLIVDEAHGAAPAGRGKWATDSQRTRSIRAIAPHFEHRLFVTATPHNGYKESFSALLELLDDQRFARGVQWKDEQLHAVMVRRLKSELPGFPKRKIEPLRVAYSDEEREAYATLKRYTDLRSKAAAKDESVSTAERFVHVLLKRRLFSSPAAFAETLAVHRDTITRTKKEGGRKPSHHVLRKAIEDVDADYGDEEEAEQAATDAMDAAARASIAPDEQQRKLLDEMQRCAARAKGRSDAKADLLLDWLEGIVRPDGEWSSERIIIFTEYRATQRWLQERLAARDLAGDRLELLYGGMEEDKRERIKAEFLASPHLSPVRILLATDAASEGIDLQRHCHRLVHYEIPWNPNRLEQRNGRIDRHGQPSPEVLIHHFVTASFEQAEPGSLDGDLEFLYTAVRKVEQIREDLGSVGPVIAEQVEEAMLGRRRSLETEAAETQAAERKVLKIERNLREETAKLRQRLDDTIDELNITPANIERVVKVGLKLARQPALKPDILVRGTDEIPVFRLPALTGSWARCSEGLIHPVTGQIRPLTFNHTVAAEHDDVVLAHLQHRLVQQSLRLLRAEIWAAQEAAELSRVTARLVPEGVLEQPAVVAHGRLVVTGADGHRLHEEVMAAGGVLKDGRFRRFGTLGELDVVLKAATLDPPDKKAYAKIAKDWNKYVDALFAAFERRARDRADSLTGQLEDRANQEVKTITTVLEDLKATIEAELPEVEQLRLDILEEREQLERDVEALRRRIDQIPQNIATETAAIRRRFADPEPRMFPAAVTFLIPEAKAR